MPPRAPKKWGGIQDAVSWGASAPQLVTALTTDPFYAWYAAIQEISEDCLFLNVFTPAREGAKRPVMVWIHGGGWRECAGTAPGFNGAALAHQQDVVVITMNHRLNAFGFLQLDGSDDRFADSGNVGMLDIVMALRWVRENAAAFGGDPDNVTLFGESGGASKIAALLAMPAAKGLFHKAILQSSGGGLRLASQEDAARLAGNLAKAMGRSVLQGEELQKLPMEALLTGLKSNPGMFRSVIDGRNFDADPFYPTGPALSAHVPVMVGTTNTETTYHLRFGSDFLQLQYPDVIRRLSRFLMTDDRRTREIMAAYRAAYPNHGPCEILTMVTTDFMFKRTASRIACLQSASATAPVYAYVFDRETPVEGGRLHSPHTSEVPFIFGTTAAAEAHVGVGADIEAMTECMMATWAAFARQGDPNNATVPLWKPFKDNDRQTMVLNVESHLTVDPGAQARAVLQDLPAYGYSYTIEAFVKN
ncbi:MAG: hypothetical protein RL300_1572 [Pseudomonadota bacterium]